MNPLPTARTPRRAFRPRAALLALSVLLLAGACTNRTEGEAAATAPGGLAVGDPAPDVTFTAIDGSRPRLAGLADAVLVSFWASDCRACLAEAPALEALRERLAPRGFELVSVAMPHDRPDFVLERAGRWRHPVALDLDGAVLAAFEPVPGTPTGFLVGPDGTVLERWSGPADVPALERRLDALLAPAPPAAGAAG